MADGGMVTIRPAVKYRCVWNRPVWMKMSRILRITVVKPDCREVPKMKKISGILMFCLRKMERLETSMSFSLDMLVRILINSWSGL